jgi:hypothetical protein
MKTGIGIKAILRFSLSNLKGRNVGIYEAGLEIASCGTIYISSFKKTGTNVQAILRFSLRNVKGCNVGITDRRDL